MYSCDPRLTELSELARSWFDAPRCPGRRLDAKPTELVSVRAGGDTPPSSAGEKAPRSAGDSGRACAPSGQ
jgi:hypothetical protein